MSQISIDILRDRLSKLDRDDRLTQADVERAQEALDQGLIALAKIAIARQAIEADIRQLEVWATEVHTR